jgi:hypothetical protein
MRQQDSPRCRCDSGSNATGVYKVATLIVAQQDRIDSRYHLECSLRQRAPGRDWPAISASPRSARPSDIDYLRAWQRFLRDHATEPPL